jgi:hypothetical protein
VTTSEEENKAEITRKATVEKAKTAIIDNDDIVKEANTEESAIDTRILNQAMVEEYNEVDLVNTKPIEETVTKDAHMKLVEDLGNLSINPQKL